MKKCRNEKFTWKIDEEEKMRVKNIFKCCDNFCFVGISAFILFAYFSPLESVAEQLFPYEKNNFQGKLSLCNNTPKNSKIFKF